MGLDVIATVSVSARMAATQDLGSVLATMNKSYGVTLTDGSLAGQANELFHDQRTLAASATEDLDLAGAVLLDPLGGTASFARVKGLVVSAAAANINNVIVGGAATNAFIGWITGATHTMPLRPGETFSKFCGVADTIGYVVTPGTGDLLRVGNSGAGSTVTYDIIIYGANV
jgi:hypothetical protein